MNTFKKYLPLIGLFLFIYHQSYAQESSSERLAENDPLNRLTCLDYHERLRASVDLDNRRDLTIEKCIAILGSTNQNSIKIQAIVVLGEYRAIQAVQYLVNNLGFDDAIEKLPRDTRAGVFPIPSEMFFEVRPVETALIKIGMSTVPALLDKITQTDDAKIIGKCVSICQAIEGMEVTQFRLQGLLDKETDPKIKVRIQSALDVLKKLNPAK